MDILRIYFADSLLYPLSYIKLPSIDLLGNVGNSKFTTLPRKGNKIGCWCIQTTLVGALGLLVFRGHQKCIWDIMDNFLTNELSTQTNTNANTNTDCHQGAELLARSCNMALILKYKWTCSMQKIRYTQTKIQTQTRIKYEHNCKHSDEWNTNTNTDRHGADPFGSSGQHGI